MLTLSSSLRAAMAASEVRTFKLFAINYIDEGGFMPGVPNPLLLTDWSENISYSGTYVAAPIKCGVITQNADGKLNDVTLTVGNFDAQRVVQRILENCEVIGQTITVHQFFKDNSGSIISEPITNTFKIKGAKAGMGGVAFTLSIGFDFLMQTLPNRIIMAKFCRWRRFKDANCKYGGAATECGRTWYDCLRYNNTVNFGGFPAVLNQRLYF